MFPLQMDIILRRKIILSTFFAVFGIGDYFFMN